MKHQEIRTTDGRIFHIMELTDDEAYHIWKLSRAKEGGDAFPINDGINPSHRVSCWFQPSTRQRFRADQDRHVKYSEDWHRSRKSRAHV